MPDSSTYRGIFIHRGAGRPVANSFILPLSGALLCKRQTRHDLVILPFIRFRKAERNVEMLGDVIGRVVRKREVLVPVFARKHRNGRLHGLSAIAAPLILLVNDDPAEPTASISRIHDPHQEANHLVAQTNGKGFPVASIAAER